MELDSKLIITQIIAFLLMLWILKKFAWKPLLRILDERKEYIQSLFDEAIKNKEEAEVYKEQYNQKIAHIHTEAQEIIKVAAKEAKTIASDIEDDAQKKAQEIIRTAHAQSERDLQKSKLEFNKEMVDISFYAIEKLIQVKLSKEERERFAFELLDKT